MLPEPAVEPVAGPETLTSRAAPAGPRPAAPVRSARPPCGPEPNAVPPD